ncbi:MAG: zinc-dependent metalloprotease, partial [Limisphaerales bacterium]
MWNKILFPSLIFVVSIGLLSNRSTAAEADKKPAQKAPVAAKKAAAKKAPAKAAPKKKKKRPSKKSKATLPLEVAPNYSVSIPKASLNRDFLMSGSMIPQAGAATSTGLAGKIVRFQLFHDGVDLYENPQGLVVTDDLPTKRLITTFPIIKQDDNQVVIDFNKGMRRVFTEIWYANSTRFSSSDRDQVAEVSMSRVFSVARDKDLLIVRQSAQVRDRRRSQNEEARYELRYFLQPYVRKKFTSKENAVDTKRYTMFFETQPQLEKTTGRSTTKIAHFDISKPVTFYWSANTPKEYVEAVRDGILYWNRAFGKPLVKAAKAPRKVTAPDAAHNIVQWVPWDSAGFAYADILVDPRTGECKHGQAYMTSVFAVSGKSRARRLLRAMREIAGDDKKEGDDKPKTENRGIRFPGSTVCHVNHRDFARRMAKDLEDILANEDLTDAAALRASQDYVREVVAHEVGHVLGLRHNFAGSIADNISREELNAWWTAYVKGDKLDKWKGKYASSSVMEYSVYKAGAFIGWQMRATEDVMPHDKGAIQWGYFNKKDVAKNKMLFATDDDMGRYGDVHVFDYGVEPVVANYAEIEETVRNIPNQVIEAFISARAPFDPRDRQPLETVNLSPRGFSSSIRMEYFSALRWLQSGTRSFRLERDYAYIGDLNKKERTKAHWKSLNAQIEKLGGVDRAFFSYLPAPLKLQLKDPQNGIPAVTKINATELGKRLEKLLESPAYSEFVGLDEKKYKFTDKEKKLIIERGKKLFAELEKVVLYDILRTLGSAKRDLGFAANESLGEKNVISALEQRIIDLADHVLNAKDESKKITG